VQHDAPPPLCSARLRRLYNATPGEWAATLAGPGFDFVAEQTSWFLDQQSNADGMWDEWAASLADVGVGFGLVPDSQDLPDRPFLAPELALYAATLPDFAGPMLRDVGMLAQRFAAFPNARGFSIGADNAGYVQYWNWAQNNPNRPYGGALLEFVAHRAVLAGRPAEHCQVGQGFAWTRIRRDR
jgi:hypothetical protein